MLTFLESILYGFVSGCSELLPVSSEAHQAMMLKLFGITHKLPFCDLLIHIAVIAAIIFGCRENISRMRRENRAYSHSRNRTYRTAGHYEMRLLKAAAFWLLLSQLLRIWTGSMQLNYVLIVIFLIVNGLLMLLQEHLPQGNKKASQMSGIDSVAMGILSALSVLPGLSRNTVIISYCVARGADRQSVINWAFLLSVPALVMLCAFDIVGIVTLGFHVGSFLIFLCYLVAAIVAFAGAYLSITLMRVLAVRTGFDFFAYYSWGAALFTIVLYLIS